MEQQRGLIVLQQMAIASMSIYECCQLAAFQAYFGAVVTVARQPNFSVVPN
jgi:hypothetical protein